MIISISGTHCTGKTTLINELKKDPFFKDAIFLSSSGKGLSKFGLHINENGDDLTQLYLACRDFQQIIENKGTKGVVICDRSIIDTYVYSKYLLRNARLRGSTLSIIESLFERVDKDIFHCFLVKPSFELVKESERSMDKKFQNKIFEIFDCSYNRAMEDGATNIEYLPDDLQGRINRIKEFIEQNLN